MQENSKRRAADTHIVLPLADQLLEAGLNASGMPAVLFSPEDEIAYISDAYRDLLDVPAHVETYSELVHHWHASGSGPQMHRDLQAELQSAMAERRKLRHRVYELNLTNGRWFLVNETVVGGAWVWNFLTEITAFKTNEQKLTISRDLAQQDAETDVLTGIYNRRAALKMLDAEIRKAQTSKRPLSVAIIDLDHFKAINDTQGHDGGDEVLGHFAVTASWQLRRSDMFARFGGEEFILIMPGAGEAEALSIVDRIRSEIVAKPISGLSIKYTFSSGIASYDGDSLKGFIRRADAALYQAKRDGRNCSRCG
ncbi:sensor domain-containing diguanylate cyclase [Rhizobium sp. L1K21]|uniref:sensor domain-containing diguanylate cyclase n=1 Tax=Rhizobium sp. L1K21 TaxID=2954933 RepID=UPI00209283F3|nr:sensor domain-containing diguanylate cyclase [Rhizobium sp. L1K21]MCO6186747.1 diguanylate cyclase [Rhizobium sp. L1K21]